MENKNASDITNLITASLDATQINGINTESQVEQILRLSNQDAHNQIISKILDDNDMDLKEKIDLIETVNAKQEQRIENNTQRVKDLQSAQTKNVEAVTKPWFDGLKWAILPTGLVILCIVSPDFRKAVATTALKGIAAA